MSEKYDYTYIALGAGVQSTALLIMSALGLKGCPKADVAIFADTQDEPSWVYEHLERLKAWSPISIHTVTIGKLSQHVYERKAGIRTRFACIPAWTRGADGREAPLRRQCTREYKITPIEKKVRELLGYRPRQRIKKQAACLLGISFDEIQRMKHSRTRWTTNLFPLVDACLTRGGCEEIIRYANIPVPKKSSCTFCPYHNVEFWRDLKENHPVDFEAACRLDDTIRDMSKQGVQRPVFIHRSLRPLREVPFTEKSDQAELFGNECGGHCGV